MYAVIETGGKQYRVGPGQTIEVELLPADPGSTVTFDRVLMVTNDDGKATVGTPLVGGGAVFGVVTREGRGKKILVFKYKSKKRYRRGQGHRQDYTYVLITNIQAQGKDLVSDAERKRYEQMATRQAERYEARLLGVAAESDEVEEAETETTETAKV
jgi:large subunit ribosomal protein L21